jgi:cyclopropane fatty-acyl-phospholipid synthase-like methyltransferase
VSNDGQSLDPSYFDRLYAEKVDPWNFTASEYERRKYSATLEALGEHHFRHAFEVGCSIGVLTRQLALLCDSVLAVDVAQAAIDRARAHCAQVSQVSLRRMHIPHEWPPGLFDLIILSEVLYFLSPNEIARTAVLSRASLARGGLVLLVNWTGETDYPCSGDQAVAYYLAGCAGDLWPISQKRAPQYRLDLLLRG